MNVKLSLLFCQIGITSYGLSIWLPVRTLLHRSCLYAQSLFVAVHIPKPEGPNGDGMAEGDVQKPEPDVPLPQTLVRIPTEQTSQQVERGTS